jgi:hypothetical protein
MDAGWRGGTEGRGVRRGKKIKPPSSYKRKNGYIKAPSLFFNYKKEMTGGEQCQKKKKRNKKQQNNKKSEV